jgi:hypothetical protein
MNDASNISISNAAELATVLPLMSMHRELQSVGIRMPEKL